MGGSAITDSKRMDNPTYNRVQKEILEAIAPYFTRCQVPPPAPEKESYGDLDVIVVPKEGVTFDPIAILGSKQIYPNGPITSFEYQGHQVDLIYTTEVDFDWMIFVLSYSYVGHLLGMIVKRLFVTLSTDGVHYRIESEGYTSQMRICNHPEQFCKFLGLEYSQWLNGFPTILSCFQWITSSRFFEVSLLESLSNKEKKRKREKTMISTFFEYLETLPKTPAAVPADQFVPLALVFFDKQKEFDALRAEHDYKNQIRTKFNGNLVTSRTGLSGKPLGDFIFAFRNDYTDEVINNMTLDQLHEAIDSLFQKRTSVTK